MRNQAPAVLPRQRRAEQGMSLLETVIALSILLVGSLGLLPLGIMAVSTTESEGHLVSRVTEYSQDKMEQLLALAYADGVTDTTKFPAVTSPPGTGLGGSFTTTPVGSSDPAAPATGYVDYLNAEGALCAGTVCPPLQGKTAAAEWFYKRVWAISKPWYTQTPPVEIKQVTVTTVVARRVGAFGIVPRATIVALKTSPF
jgi:hypothetical protein